MSAWSPRCAAVASSVLLLAAACNNTSAIQEPVPEERPPGDTLVLVTEDESDRGLWGRPVDQATLDDHADHEPVDLGHHYTTAFSRDGGTLATMTWPTDGQAHGSLTLIDLAEWGTRLLDLGIESHVSEMLFDEDGTLYMVQPDAHREPLSRLIPGSENTEPLAGLPEGFVPWEMQLQGAGHLVLFGVPVDPNRPHFVEGPPRIVALDTRTGDLVYQTILEEVHAGQDESTATETGVVYHTPGLAWDHTRDLLYVVDAASGEITVVDLMDGAILPPPSPSLAERLGRWLMPPAQAKLMAGTDRQAVISRDGSRLYITGLRRELEERATGWRYTERPLGVSVVDTSTLEARAHVDLPASEIELSPDGQHLITIHRPSGPDQTRPPSVSILDARTLEERGRFTGNIRLAGFSLDGRLAYLTQWHQPETETFETMVQIIDLSTLTVTEEKTFPGTYLAIHPESRER